MRANREPQHRGRRRRADASAETALAPTITVVFEHERGLSDFQDLSLTPHLRFLSGGGRTGRSRLSPGENRPTSRYARSCSAREPSPRVVPNAWARSLCCVARKGRRTFRP